VIEVIRRFAELVGVFVGLGLGGSARRKWILCSSRGTIP